MKAENLDFKFVLWYVKNLFKFVNMNEVLVLLYIANLILTTFFTNRKVNRTAKILLEMVLLIKQRESFEIKMKDLTPVVDILTYWIVTQH